MHEQFRFRGPDIYEQSLENGGNLVAEISSYDFSDDRIIDYAKCTFIILFLNLWSWYLFDNPNFYNYRTRSLSLLPISRRISSELPGNSAIIQGIIYLEALKTREEEKEKKRKEERVWIYVCL